MLRFGNLKIVGLPDSSGELAPRITNIGDFAQLLAIDELYHSLGISNIVDIDLSEMEKERETVFPYTVLPINYLYATNTIYNQLLNLSDHIIPVYLGLSIMYPAMISDQQIDYLKRYEPIGCRDERTMNFLRGKGIDAYLFGCIVATLPKSNVPIEQRDVVYFIDAPFSIMPYIPSGLYSKIKFVDHEKYEYTSFAQFEELKIEARQRIEEYRNHAKLIVTSRFHAAVLGLALGIPTIVVLENNFFKWSWISKYLKVYTPDMFGDINWECDAVDFEPVKQQMLKVAKKRIADTYEKYDDIYSMSMMQENPFRSDEPNLLYYTDALSQIDELWRDEPQSEYILWGDSDNAKKIHEYIQKKYPKVKLRAIYDMYKINYVEYAQMQTICPSKEILLRDKDIFTIVTSNTAKKAAVDFFNSISKSSQKYILCDLNFLTNNKFQQYIESMNKGCQTKLE